MKQGKKSRVEGLAEFIGQIAPSGQAASAATSAENAFLAPEVFRDRLAEILHVSRADVIVAGPADHRLVLVRSADHAWRALMCDGSPLSSLAGYGFPPEALDLQRPDAALSLCKPGKAAIKRLTFPRVHLVSLHRPEIFPLPRFALGIAVLASTLRRRFLGTVSLDDMQLGRSLDDVAHDARLREADIVGISATFLQHQLLDELLRMLGPRPGAPPCVVLGGSLPVLILDKIIEHWPTVWVCTGPGEDTLTDAVRWQLGELPQESIRGIAHLGAAGINKSDLPNKDRTATFTPELDLLDKTLAAGGVLNLETSRGCTNACSFCPRDHKGIWQAAPADAFDPILDDISAVFDRHPTTPRKIFLVDEEFIGRLKDGSEPDRVVQVTRGLFDRDFRWEASTRIDQVAAPAKGRAWHAQRINFWRSLLGQGLDRCLFGVESGVDSVLQRFNKQTSRQQNIQAVRTLTACGVPIRCSYITFDHQMTFEELLATYRFMGRRDAILVPCNDLSAEALADAIHDPAFIATASLDMPLYSYIPYMLVTLELFAGCPYVRSLHTGDARKAHMALALGKLDMKFVDERIGLISDWAQRWIDRHFSFDYTLKSLQKITDVSTRREIGKLRGVLKDYAYLWLGNVLTASTGDESLLDAAHRPCLAANGPLDRRVPLSPNEVSHDLTVLSDLLFAGLRQAVTDEMPTALASLSSEHAGILRREHDRWADRTKWELLHVDS